MDRDVRFTWSGLLIFLVVAGGLALPVTVAIRAARRAAVIAKCADGAHRIVIAQQDYQEWPFGPSYHGPGGPGGPKGGPQYYVRGTEHFCRPAAEGRATSHIDAAHATDASRAFLFLAKSNCDMGLGEYACRLSEYICPADPFAAALDCASASILPGDGDFPPENGPAAPRWTSPDSPAGREAGHTWYSYSMQAGSPDARGNLSHKMLSELPLVSERNPFSLPLNTLAGTTPTADGFDNGNSWNHNREGQTLAFRDGSARFLTDARMLEMPQFPLTARTAAVMGYDYIYGDDPVSDAPPSAPALPPPPYTGVGSDQPPRAVGVFSVRLRSGGSGCSIRSAGSDGARIPVGGADICIEPRTTASAESGDAGAGFKSPRSGRAAPAEIGRPAESPSGKASEPRPVKR